MSPAARNEAIVDVVSVAFSAAAALASGRFTWSVHVVRSVHVSPHDGRIAGSEYVRVYHPTEQVWHEASAHSAARSFGGDWTPGSEHRLPIGRLGPARPLITWWKAQIHMLVPLGNAERDTLIERLLGGSSRLGVHRSNEREAAIGILPIQQRRGPRRIEAERLGDRIAPAREVIDLLWDVRQELGVAVRDGGVHVAIFRERLTHADHEPRRSH